MHGNSIKKADTVHGFRMCMSQTMEGEDKKQSCLWDVLVHIISIDGKQESRIPPD